MKTQHLSVLTLVTGILSAAGCGSSTPGGGGNEVASGGSQSTAGAQSTGGPQTAGAANVVGGLGSSGTSTVGSGGSLASSTAGTGAGGALANGGSATGSGGTVAAGGGSAGRTGSGGSSAGGGTAGGAAGSAGAGGSTSSGTCTAAKAASTKASGTGTHKVVVETNADKGISEGTIYRPADLGGAEKYPIFVWGEGGCSEDGASNAAAVGEIASHGYFVIADGTPGSTASRAQTSDTVGMGKPMLAYITWAIAENEKPCSAYYHSLDTTKVAANGFSCGGLMAEGTAGDPRITTWGLNSSGLITVDQNFYKTVHTPVLIVLGGSGDIAYTNGERDYDSISALGIPIMLFSKAGAGHGGDLFVKNGGDFAKIDLAWLNWQLKGDTTATGKGLLVGSSCSYCSNSTWEVKSKNLP